MKTVILILATILGSYCSAFSKACDNSTLTIRNTSTQSVTIDHVNNGMLLATRTRGTAINLKAKTKIAPGKSHTVTFQNSALSGYGNWGSFDLIQSDGNLAARVNYDFHVYTLFDKSCKSAVIIDAGQKPVHGKSTDGSPAKIDVQIS